MKTVRALERLMQRPFSSRVSSRRGRRAGAWTSRNRCPRPEAGSLQRLHPVAVVVLVRGRPVREVVVVADAAVDQDVWCGVLRRQATGSTAQLAARAVVAVGRQPGEVLAQGFFDNVGRKSSIGVKPLSCSTIRWMVMSLTEKLVRIARVSSPVGYPKTVRAIVAQLGADDERRVSKVRDGPADLFFDRCQGSLFHVKRRAKAKTLCPGSCR